MENTLNSTVAIIDSTIKNDKIPLNEERLANQDNNNGRVSPPTIAHDGKYSDSEKDVSETAVEKNITETGTDELGVSLTSCSQSNTNISTKVNLDLSVTERLACLSLASEENPLDPPPKVGSSETNDNVVDEPTPEKPKRSDELSRSILAGEISDNSECSVDEASDYVDDKVETADASDEEMFIEDQDEDVEEEEEFHEVEEEKHKTSQESVGSTKDEPSLEDESKELVNPSSSHPPTSANIEVAVTEAETSKAGADNNIEGERSDSKASTNKNADWADIMLSNIQGNTDEAAETTDNIPNKDDTDSQVAEKTGEEGKKELDLDEDVKNPQYIPKKGVFYEHDDRSHEVNSKKQSITSTRKEDDATESKDSTKKSVSQEKQSENKRGPRKQRAESDRWNHDLFKGEKQKPKSKSELVNAYGYDIRHERSSRNQGENRPPRGINTSNTDRQQVGPDNQRSRQGRDHRSGRQNQLPNRSRDRRSRKPNNRRGENSGTPPKRDVPNRPSKLDSRDLKYDVTDGKQGFQHVQHQSPASSTRRENRDSRDRSTRNEPRTRRQDSNDRPSIDSTGDKLPPITTVMPPITTWSNKIEDMVKEEASRKESPSRLINQQNQGNNVRARSNDYWPQNQTNRTANYDKTTKNSDDGRQQGIRRYQDRDELHKANQFVSRNNYNERSNQHQEWRRGNHHGGSYVKSHEYEPIKTQTFENSRLSQMSMNRSNYRDARDIITERRTQQNYQPKGLHNPNSEPQLQQVRQMHQQHQNQQQIVQQHNHHVTQHQASHMRQQQQPTQNQNQQQPTTQAPNSIQVHRQPHQTSQGQQHAPQSRQPQSMIMNNVNSDGVPDHGRINANSSSPSDSINSRPIVKTDAYTGSNSATHAQPLQQHSQNHRSMGGPLSQQGPNSANPHLVPSHLGAGATQHQYYSPSNNSRDSAAAVAALANAYHGYMPSGHSVMDTTRYHMTSQQLADHGYMTGQSNEAASVMHQQGMYPDAATAGGTVASSAYMSQAGSTLSPSSNIPVTGTGPPPLAPVSYIQHSQYPPPPYSNPYSQPQHNQAPPQSNPAYPYWTYI